MVQLGRKASEFKFEDSKATKPSLPIPPEIAESEELQFLETVELKSPVSVHRMNINNS